MSDDDPDILKGPGGLTLRQVHEQVKKSVARDREAQTMRYSQKTTRWQLALALAAIGLVPLLFGSYVALSYHLALRGGRLPYTNQSEWVSWSVLFGLLATGGYLVWLSARRAKALSVAVYLFAMTPSLFFILIWVACMYGDCL
ncbi:MAG TPA: hypothetical protein VFB01_01270 [Burkholderiales bacterium]|nr:hypothetical protein [Burkholderiales bacterium]